MLFMKTTIRNGSLGTISISRMAYIMKINAYVSSFTRRCALCIFKYIECQEYVKINFGTF